MKIVRYNEKDVRDVLEVNKTVSLDRDTFVARMGEEMGHVAPRKPLYFQFIAMMEELYGSDEADRIGKALTTRWGTLED